MEKERSVFIVGIDESKQSFHALEWALDSFFAPFSQETLPYKLVILHVRPVVSSYVGMAGPGASDILPMVEHDLHASATKVTERAREICVSKSVTDFTTEVKEGDARNVLCEAVERHHASMLIVGSHGYGAIKRAVLGSVSDYCAHHAHCTVMIVKMPKV
ncbi:universal stress protein PHOS34-like [Nymphaea colorata]|nr:universal stress protein PHOS34-like [Nymphaea colorata]